MRREIPRRFRAMRRRALRIRWRTGAASYARGWLVLKTGLAAAPLAPFIGPVVRSRLRPPEAIEARAASLSAALLVFVMLVRAVIRDGRRSQREAAAFLVSVVVVSGVAAHVIRAQANAFILPDLLYQAMAALLGLSALSAALRTETERAPETGLPEDGEPFFSPYRALSDALTTASAGLVVAFWGLAALGLHYVAAFVLIVLSGAIGTTLLLRVAESVVPSFRSPRYRRAIPLAPSDRHETGSS
jgi:hypothetical protein